MSTGARTATGRWWGRTQRRPRRVPVANEPPPRPLFRPAPRSAMFVPMVVVAAVLPGLYALNWWDLVPPGPWWGLRGLAVLEGLWLDQSPMTGVGPPHEAAAYRAVALQPPLYAWLEAVCLRLSPSLNPLATVLPGYVAGVLVVMLVFGHGRLWRGPGVGVVAALLMAFSRDLLVQMQQASPATLGVAGLMGALLAYGRALRADDGRSRGWLVAAAGLCLGLSFLAVSLFGLVGVAIVAAHQAILAGAARARRSIRRKVRIGDLLRMSLILAAAGALTLAIAAPWHLAMLSRHGDDFIQALIAPPRPSWTGDRDALAAVLTLAPAALPLAALGFLRVVSEVIHAEPDDPAAVGGSFWLVWLVIATIGLLAWRSGPRSALILVVLVPVNLLAARAMTDLAARRLPARRLSWLAPAVMLSVAAWLSSSLRGAVVSLIHGRPPMAHEALWYGLIVLLVLATRRLDRWARRDDRHRRAALCVLLASVLAVTAGAGLREVRFRHVETAELLDLRGEILRRDRLRPLTALVVVSPEAIEAQGATPGGRLRLILRTALPRLPQTDCSTTDALLGLPGPPNRQRLVVLVGPDASLPYRFQSQLGLEALHAGRTGMLDAFATTYVPPRRRR